MISFQHKLAYNLLQKFALIPVITGDGEWEAYIDIILEMPQIKISGWCCHWFPYRVAVNCEDQTRDSGLTQVKYYTCGPLPVVKFVEALFCLSIPSNVKFSGARAKRGLLMKNGILSEIPFPLSYPLVLKMIILFWNCHANKHGIKWMGTKICW